MSEIQFNELINVLKIISESKYTITGASDWPLLVALVAIIVSLLVYIWQDLKNTMKENKVEWQIAIDKEEAEREKQDDYIWTAMRSCQDDCCPRKGK